MAAGLLGRGMLETRDWRARMARGACPCGREVCRGVFLNALFVWSSWCRQSNLATPVCFRISKIAATKVHNPRIFVKIRIVAPPFDKTEIFSRQRCSTQESKTEPPASMHVRAQASAAISRWSKYEARVSTPLRPPFTSHAPNRQRQIGSTSKHNSLQPRSCSLRQRRGIYTPSLAKMTIDINMLRPEKGGDPSKVIESEKRRFRDGKAVCPVSVRCTLCIS